MFITTPEPLVTCVALPSVLSALRVAELLLRSPSTMVAVREPVVRPAKMDWPLARLQVLGQGQIGFLKGVKAALSEMGLVKNVMSAPFSPFSGRELARVSVALKALRRMGAE